METRTRLVIVDSGLPRPVAQYVIRDSEGRFIARVDLAYPVERVALEYEGDHHRERATFRRDIARVNALTTLGWIVIRVTADDIYRNPSPINATHCRGSTSALRMIRIGARSSVLSPP